MKTKKTVIKSLILIALLVIAIPSFSQGPPGAGGLLGTTQTTLGGQWVSFKSIMGYIGGFFFCGGIILALYAYLYDQSRMKTATISLIAGALLLTIGGAMNYL